MSTKRKALLNFFSGMIAQVISLLLALIVPRLVLVNYGSDTNGFTNTVTQVFTYMALLESGIAQAAKNALYKPIKEDDRETISRIISTAKKYYNRITIIYFVLVIAISIIVPFLLKSDIDYFTMFAYILLQGLTNVIIFYFVQKRSTFLSADGKAYVVNFIYLLNKLLCYAAYIILAILQVNIAAVQFAYFLLSFIQLLIYYLYMKRKYNRIQYNISEKNDILKDRNSYVVSEIAWTIFSSTDMIVLSIFVSTSMASVYSVYNMVFLALSNILSSVFVALNYRLGLSFYKDLNEYKAKHDFYIGLFLGIMCALMAVSYLLIIPFVKLYTEGVGDVEYIYKELPILFCLIQIISWSRYIPGNLVGLSGHQREAIKINVLEAVLNVTLSIILVSNFGIIGVLIATVVVLPIKVIYCIYVSDKKVLKRSMRKTFKLLLPNYVGFFIFFIIGHLFEIDIDNYLSFLLFGFFFSAIAIFTFLIINLVFNKEIRYKFLNMCFRKEDRI